VGADVDKDAYIMLLRRRNPRLLAPGGQVKISVEALEALAAAAFEAGRRQREGEESAMDMLFGKMFGKDRE
jgi:hypothetical protein